MYLEINDRRPQGYRTRLIDLLPHRVGKECAKVHTATLNGQATPASAPSHKYKICGNPVKLLSC